MVNVSAAIILNEDSVLLARRASGENLAGMWEFPGGKQKPDETILQCVQRELMEELSVNSIAGEIVAESRFEYSAGLINLVGILVKLESVDFKLNVHDKVEWVPVKNILDYRMPPADIPIAMEIIKRYG